MNYIHPLHSGRARHVGIIPDGNRRWALAQKISLTEAYIQTAAHLGMLVANTFKSGVEEVSVYAASFENLKRPADEVESLIESTGYALDWIINEFQPLHGFSFHLVGKQDIIKQCFPKVPLAIRSWDSAAERRLNVCLFYHPVDEIARAIHRDSAPENIFNNLDITRPLDLVVRTGGYRLLSNFLPLQSAYARLYFFDELFNDFTWSQLQSVLENYANEVRRYGD